MKQPDKKLVLANGKEFPGIGSGASGSVVGEIVFNTAVEGYQEMISDPAYYGQIIVLTYPTIGQYGITDEDFESRMPAAAGVVMRENCETPSNFRYTKTLSEELESRGVPAITGLDTRMLTKEIRDNGCCVAAIVDASVSTKEALEMIKAYRAEECLVKNVSCQERRFYRTSNHRFDVVVLDCGVKHSTIMELNRLGCNVTMVPYDSTAEDILGFNPDGILISSGPGAPDQSKAIIDAVSKLRGRLPILGIGLGCQILALSYGASVKKMKCGHHGGRPVRDLKTGRIYSAEHNHNYEIGDSKSFEVSFRDLTDGSVEGIKNNADKVIGYQFYPCGAPGPQDCKFLLNEFIAMMEK